MAIDWAVWGPPLATVIGGGVAARVLLQQLGDRGNGDEAVLRETRANDLQTTHLDVLEQLRHLETEREKLQSEEYDAEHRRLVARGSRALAALEEAGLSPVAGPIQQDSPPADAPRSGAAKAAAPPIGAEWRGALYALAAVALGFTLWKMLQGEAAPRGEGASMTGNLPGEVPGGSMADPTQSPDFKAREAAFEATLAGDPKNMDALNGLTYLFLSHGAPEKAFDWSKKALEASPKDKDARVYRSVVTAMMGMMDPAVLGLDQVLAEDPTFQRALVYKGLILLELGRFEDAEKVLEVALAQEPDNTMLRERLAQAKAKIPTGGAPPPPAPGGGGVLVAGTLTIAADAKATLKGSEVLYLSLSEPGRPGPPVAATRIEGPYTFPMTFQLTTADIRAMPGSGSLPAVMELKVRFDGDGNAMTKEPGLPIAVVTGIPQGAAGLPVSIGLSDTPVPAPAGLSVAPAAAPSPSPRPGAGGGAGGGGGAIASGRVTLGAGVVATGTETVFVIVKDPAAGPMPLAVKKLPPQFPLEFVLTDADMMAGPGTIPDQITVSVRLDLDGNPTTKDGPKAELGAARGSSGLAFTLQ